MKKVIVMIAAFMMLLLPGVVLGTNDPNVKEAASYVPPVSQSTAVGVIQAKQVDPASIGAPPAPSCPGCSEVCWTAREGQLYSQWGIWPWSQRVTENRDWCAYWLGGPQYYRTSHVYLTSPRCGLSGAYGTRVDGGNGYTWTTVRSGGHFYCDGWNFDDWMEFACNTWGHCSFVRRGRL